MIVAVNVNSHIFQLEPYVVSTVVTRRELLPINARDFVRFAVSHIVNNGVDYRRFTLLSRLKDISDCCHVLGSLLLRPEHGRIALRGRLFQERLESG